MTCEICPDLAKRNEELQAEIAQLKFEFYGMDHELPAELRLTWMESDIVRALMAANGRPLTKEFLLEATRHRGLKADTDTRVIDTMACKIRRKLNPHGLQIETVWGRGYAVPAETRNRLLTWNTTSSVAA